jgi:hypothetical protein
VLGVRAGQQRLALALGEVGHGAKRYPVGLSAGNTAPSTI